MHLSAGLDPKRFADQAFERASVPRRRPKLELRVPGRSRLQQSIVAAIVKLEPRYQL